MSSSFSKFCSWLARKLLMVVFLALAGFATYGLRLFVLDADGYQNALGVHSAYREHCEKELASLDEQIAKLDAAIAGQAQREMMAGRVIKSLRKLDNTWDRLIWNHAQQAANDEQLAQMVKMEKTINADLTRLRRERVLKEQDRVAAKEELAHAERTLKDLGRGRALDMHYAREAWHQGRCYVGVILAVYLIGPSLACIAFYYGLAPVVVRGRPLRLAEGEPEFYSTAGADREVMERSLWPGEVFHGKKKFLATADGDLAQKSRVLLSWRFPFASLACGLFNLAEVRNVRNAGGRRITLAGPGEVAEPFKVIDVPEGSSLVLRPGFLAGLISATAEPLVIRRHLRFFHWQSWVSGQFRFFEFIGPCRLILAGHNALKVDSLAEHSEVPVPVARVKQSKVAAFTPNLECRPVRAVSFWRYYIGATPLFEAGFSGRGLLVYATPGGGTGIKSCACCRRLLRVFGL